MAKASAQLADVQDQFVFYFGRSTALASDIAGSTFDANGDAWVIGRDSLGGIRKVEFDGNRWVNDRHVFATEMRIYYRATDVAGGIEGDLQISGNLGGTPANFLLNPAPLTIEIPTGPQTPGATQTVTYQPGELAFFTDAQGLLAPVGGGQVFEATKRLTRYDLRKTQTPTTVEPDFGNYFNEGQQAGFFGNTDWNDVFTQVISEQDIRDAAGATNGGDNFGRSFAWSSDGQSIYAVDAGTNTGGIYKIDATQTGAITRLRTDVTSASDPDRGLTVVTRILGEPAVLNTSVLDLDPTSSAVGDQIVVPGTGDGGNVGGVNVYTDAGLPGELPDPHTLFTDQQFREFSDYYGFTPPNYLSLEFDDAGNLYFYEFKTFGLYRYDTEGRFSSLATEREHNAFQEANGGARNQNFLDLQTRESTLPGFEATEVFYTDDGLQTIAGVLAYKAGDFDRDNDVDDDDLALFADALTIRNAPSPDENSKFNLSGTGVIDLFPIDPDDPVEFEYRNVRRGEAVVDWKDVKVLQQFADIPNGDTNFDGALDFVDLDTMAANYFTVAGQTEETWLDGDFASIDPRYLYDAVDANLVNEVDLGVIADAWLNDLGQPAPTESELNARYDGQFLVDALAAFAADPGLPGDYNGDGFVNAQDYDVWVAAFGTADSVADGNGDGVVDAADFTVWRDAFAATALPGDANGDGAVDLLDLDILGTNFGASGVTLAQGDFNGDGTVDLLDLDILGPNFGATASEAVPEPSALAVLACAVLGFRRW